MRFPEGAVPDTTCHMSISLDGYAAGPDQSRDNPLGTRGRELHGRHIGDPRGAYVMGRNMFDPIPMEGGTTFDRGSTPSTSSPWRCSTPR
jgi:hypothetical protein